VYEYLEGTIAARSAARVVLDVSGVGYDIQVPLGTAFPSSGRARIWTHLVVREDAHTLCGFSDRETRDLFRLLLSVRGVGPTMALGILSGLPREPLLEAVANGDAATLTRIRGVGKKTAEQILLDMREKATLLRAELGKPAGAPSAAAAAKSVGAIDDAVQALVSIGYSAKEAKKSVERAAERVDAKNLELLVRTALTS
jgi:Holliday junction DNA helicase RuvA